MAKKSKGLGDTVEKITEATGIKKAIKWAFGNDCGCDERKEVLNKAFPYKNPECLKQKEYNFLTKLFAKNAVSLSKEDNVTLHAIYNRVFNDKKKATSCGSCVRSTIKQLKKIHSQYGN